MSDVEYLSLRARQELRAAINSTDYRARQIHLELADAYALRLREQRAIERRSSFLLLKAD